ncbi:hypothetical protein EVAR_47764_1 [Eumeta japonica]|uniref:Uncharacterized protein n=1 Tax=Eumeta variegata TaxID=151549 RepID=A0A4C1XX28_EUMVA|nr:hypothetical protein EVAR_47764_1 [Eumeta japonica]
MNTRRGAPKLRVSVINNSGPEIRTESSEYAINCCQNFIGVEPYRCGAGRGRPPEKFHGSNLVMADGKREPTRTRARLNILSEHRVRLIGEIVAHEECKADPAE